MSAFSVYVITDDDGREYVGCTGQHPETRFAHHCGNTAFTGGPHSIATAMRRKGADKFAMQVLARGLTFEQAAAAERQAILDRGSLFPGGYNLKLTSAGLGNSRHAKPGRKAA